jgi:hypothetical protein
MMNKKPASKKKYMSGGSLSSSMKKAAYKAGGVKKAAPKAKAGLKKPTSSQSGLKKLPTSVRNNMGYMKNGGAKKTMMKMGGVRKKK